MALTRIEKERVTDSRLKIQSVASSLVHVDREKIPDLEEIQKCLEEAEKNLSEALKS